jgi:hypothetical protein
MHSTEDIAHLHEQSRSHGQFVEEVRRYCLDLSAEATESTQLAILGLIEDFKAIAWSLHHLTGILSKLAPAEMPRKQPKSI